MRLRLSGLLPFFLPLLSLFYFEIFQVILSSPAKLKAYSFICAMWVLSFLIFKSRHRIHKLQPKTLNRLIRKKFNRFIEKDPELIANDITNKYVFSFNSRWYYIMLSMAIFNYIPHSAIPKSASFFIINLLAWIIMRLAFISKKELTYIYLFLFFLILSPFLLLLVERIDEIKLMPTPPESIVLAFQIIGINQPTEIQLATAISSPAIIVLCTLLGIRLLLSSIYKKILVQMIIISKRVIKVTLSVLARMQTLTKK